MARGTSFADLIDMFREETGRATSRSLGQNELPAIKRRLRRTYRWLHNDFAWPHLKVWRDKVVNAGDRYFTLPTDLDFERVRPEVWCKRPEDTEWYPLVYGINYVHYNFTDSDAGEREDYPHAWQYYENDQIELWPVPSVNDITLRFHGWSRPKPLVSESEVLDLDDELIVMYAAAAQLQRDKAPDAMDLAQQARAYYLRLRGRQIKSGPVNMAQGAGDRSGRTFRGPDIDFAERYD